MEAIIFISLAIFIILLIVRRKGVIESGILQDLANVATVATFIVTLASIAIIIAMQPPDNSTTTPTSSSASSSSVVDQDPEEGIK